MIHHDIERIVNFGDNLMIDGDIDGIIFKGDERTAEMRRNYEGMNFEDLRLQQLQVGTNCLAMGGRGFPEEKEGNILPRAGQVRAKGQLPIDSYYKEAMRGAKPEKLPRSLCSPKQIDI